MRRGQAGFTLVELLLALTLMSMLMALAYGGLRASTRAADKGQDVLRESGQIRMAHQFVRRQFSQVLPLVFEQSTDNLDSRVFEGSSIHARFVAPMPGYLGFGGPQVQELALVPGDDGKDLVLMHAPLQGFEDAHLYQREPIVLLSHIRDGGFLYQGRTEENELTGWMNQWSEADKVPESVALEIEFSDEIYLDWPPLTAAVKIDANAVLRLAGSRSMNQQYSETIRKLIDRRSQGDQ